MDSEAELQAIDVNIMSSTQRVSDNSMVSQSFVWYITFLTPGKASRAVKLCLTSSTQCKTFDSPELNWWEKREKKSKNERE